MITTMTLEQMQALIVTTATNNLTLVDVQTGFGKVQRFGKAEDATAVVWLQTLTAEQGGFYGTVTQDSSYYEQSGALADATFGVSLYLPYRDEREGTDLLQALCIALAAEQDGDFYHFALSETTFDQSTQCFVTTLSIGCRFMMLQQRQTVCIQSVTVSANQTEED